MTDPTGPDDAFDLDLDEPAAPGGGEGFAGFPAPPPRWEDLTDVEETSTMGELTAWVAWLMDRYGLVDVPPACWADHGAVVEELSALRAAREAAYDPMAQPGDALAWHAQLPDALDRIGQRWAPRCRGGDHRPPYRGGDTDDARTPTSPPA
ncbi:hypothetical protein HC251_25230 (plasmid) [Iamia sp. SCSIO 61187]|uniref:hypothetical protein n=1 Tax=Iamia sp. SCSIO 61187 TaxID=2722752 RepID=UPI001C62ACCD|nr:hypothetical protein [Iamia sp. SCSIO 61187]QYG95854.1 hypothetical protein HC251_25230 [Iamia sp. SCSIO 61187]